MRGTIWFITRLRYLSFNAKFLVSTPFHCPAMWKMNPSRRCSPSVTRSRPSLGEPSSRRAGAAAPAGGVIARSLLRFDVEHLGEGRDLIRLLFDRGGELRRAAGSHQLPRGVEPGHDLLIGHGLHVGGDAL